MLAFASGSAGVAADTLAVVYDKSVFHVRTGLVVVFGVKFFFISELHRDKSHGTLVSLPRDGTTV